VRHPRRTLGLLALAVGTAVALLTTGAAVSADGPNLAYSKDVSWHVDGSPEISAMEGTIRKVLSDVHVTYSGVDGQQIEGFFPGPTYSYSLPGFIPYYLYIRDTATDLPMVRYYYGGQALRSTIEEFLREQYPDGSVSATINPDHKVDKATVVSDEETSAIVDATEAYDALPDPAWLNQTLRGQTLIERLNRAMSWVLETRRDSNTQLIKRAHTTDWGDIKWEPNSDPSHMAPGDQWTVSIYDQAIAYGALRGLARLNAAAGRDSDRARWETEAANLKAATNQVLWQDDPQHGFYRIHKHVPPDHVTHDFNEGDIVAIGNAAAIYYGLADPDKVPRILAALEQARIDAGASKPGLSLDPPYNGWMQIEMDQGTYQNGALWDWWAGRQISAEFWSGYSALARDHLSMVAKDWASHPGQVREWESPNLKRTGADQAYAGAAAVMGQSVIDGLFGIRLVGNEVSITPRLDGVNGGVRVYEPSTDIYVAYEYSASDRAESVQYGSNSPTALSVHLPVRWHGDTRARLDGKDWLPLTYQRVGQSLLGTVVVPSGTHKVDLLEVPSGRKRF
jgi:Bacterial alpha-L-rhamnosidase 6 hairpin glycosidase domain